MKLTKDFYCVLKDEIYPVVLKAGSECPVEHEAAAREVGALDSSAKPAKATKPATVTEKDILE